ncbi:RNA polymerase sigma factor, sigma-70 family [Acididesulfobacillus acetoxydans]|uniref:RNA polymerase sigma factor, sigma-70 n=1 Tax=Acididesulfobacillus acetoxydans TaxID=1561005 RepID=A0A8S0WGD5_9FIRM|nr:sigma-70 family RNA polymerase sigma factor [Acididesulfobacillus acetoxydans]CAA7601802.1 RNA polymerase sigma factor, sigma-70 family [Acididesulfobacillus acetoxydans]CEJ09222.1 RNA polymerase sigma factor, sigma-70 [Acididesulfobacillus acetoxydans]
MESQLSFDDIYEQLFSPVYRFVKVRIPGRDIEDVVAEIMAKIWRALPTFRGPNLKPWALRIAYHHVADYYRRSQRIPALVPLEDNLRGSDPCEETAALLHIGQVLAGLPPKHTAVIQLRLVEGLSADDVAGILGITHEAVDSMLYRAKKGFRKIYHDLETAGGEQK